MTLTEHARRELSILGEDRDFVDGLVKVVEAFAAMGHSGGSAEIAARQLERLLRYKALSPLTGEPAEWADRSVESGYPLWQNVRDPSAFSSDGGTTFWLLEERDAAGSEAVTPVHRTAVRA